MTPDQTVKMDLLKEHYYSVGLGNAELFKKLSHMRERDPRFPDVPVGETVDALYAEIEAKARKV